MCNESSVHMLEICIAHSESLRTDNLVSSSAFIITQAYVQRTAVNLFSPTKDLFVFFAQRRAIGSKPFRAIDLSFRWKKESRSHLTHFEIILLLCFASFSIFRLYTGSRSGAFMCCNITPRGHDDDAWIEIGYFHLRISRNIKAHRRMGLYG